MREMGNEVNEMKKRQMSAQERWMLRDVEVYLVDHPEALVGVVGWLRDELESENEGERELRHLMKFMERLPKGRSLSEWRKVTEEHMARVFELMARFEEDWEREGEMSLMEG